MIFHFIIYRLYGRFRVLLNDHIILVIVGSTSHGTPVATMTSGGTILTLTPQQLAEVQVAKEQQPKGAVNQASMLFDPKHRRRSHTTDGS